MGNFNKITPRERQKILVYLVTARNQQSGLNLEMGEVVGSDEITSDAEEAEINFNKIESGPHSEPQLFDTNQVHSDKSEIIAHKDDMPRGNYQNKRKRKHMDAVECFQRAETSVGAVSLTDPHVFNGIIQRNKPLLPVDRSKRRKPNTDRENNGQQNHCEPFQSSQPSGFVSASDMYKLHVDRPTENVNIDLNRTLIHNETKSKKSGIKQIRNQGSILSYMKPSSTATNHDTVVKKENDGEDVLPGSQGSQRSLMYSPIKKVEDSGAIYISDSSPTSSPLTSKSSNSYSGVQGKNSDNSVVKKLFDGQKNASKNDKSRQRSKPSKPTQKSKVGAKITKKETYCIDSDEIDVDAMSSSCDDKSSIKKEKETLHDKYGLLGSGSYPKQKSDLQINYFERLPLEVLEIIFCQLPMLDLCLNSNRVCMQWNDIIADEKVNDFKVY